MTTYRRLVFICALALVGLLAKAVQAGTYIDDHGQPHPWHITKTHVLIWDGKPYIPFGGMFVSCYIYNPTEQNLTADRRALQMDRQAGIQDLYLNSRTGSAPITQRIINLFEALGFHYGLQFPTGTTTTEPGYEINAAANVKLVHQAGVAHFAVQAPYARYIVVAADSGRLLDSGLAVGTAEGLDIDVPHCPSGGAWVKLVPWTSTANWIASNAKATLAWLKPLRLGPNMRFLLDPIANEYSPPQGFLPGSATWRHAFAKWLRRRYQTLPAIVKAWGIQTRDFKSFQQAARLIPLLAGGKNSGWTQLGYAADDKTDGIFKLNMATCRMWLDMGDFRDVFLRRRADHICRQLRACCDVPMVAKRTGESTRLWISRTAREGFDGLGMETYGTGSGLGRFNGAATYADLAQSKRPLWCLATETSSTTWTADHVGYRTQAQMYRDFNEMLALGAKGIFTFGLSLRASSGDNSWTPFELNNNPRQLHWLALFGQAARARTAWLDYVPKTAFWFPVENTDARNFLDADLKDYGISGCWEGRHTVLALGPYGQAMLAGSPASIVVPGKPPASNPPPYQWVAPVFYPGGLSSGSLVLYSRQLTVNPLLAHDWTVLRAQVPAERRLCVPLTDPVKLPEHWKRRLAPPPALVDIRISEVVPGVKAAAWRDQSGQPWILLQASGGPVRIKISDKVRADLLAMVRRPGARRFHSTALPLTISLPGCVLAKHRFVFVNTDFTSAGGRTFSEAVGAEPKGIMIRGVLPHDLLVQVVGP